MGDGGQTIGGVTAAGGRSALDRLRCAMQRLDRAR